ncbi:MAG: hypothetical protein GY940_40455, partial [bacterium]|nr:hypothetical protein [bacterium]
NYGPLDFAMFWEFGTFRDVYNTQYTPNNSGQNHRLSIVGWDDNYPASNFLYPPPGNGAFIARNSWGPGWAEGGYCYISYYDASLKEFTSFNNAESVSNYGSIYYHDPLGRTRSWGKDAWGGNVFTAVNNLPLKAVGFYANDANLLYEIYIYKNIDVAANNPRSGTLMAVKTGSFIYPGYYTVDLDSTVPLQPGELFSVVIYFNNTGAARSVPLEYPIQQHSSAATANPGESYVSRDGTNW